MFDYWFELDYWLRLVLVSSFIFSLTHISFDFLTKKKSKNYNNSTGAEPFHFIFFRPVLQSIYASITILVLGIGIPSHLGLILLTGAFHFLILLPFYTSYKHSDATVIGPLFQLSPLFTLIVSFMFLGEKISGFDLLGFALMLTGAIFISKKKNGEFKIGKVFWLMLLVSLMLGVHFTFIRYLIDWKHVSALEIVLWNRFGLLAALLLFCIFSSKVRASIKRIKTLKKKTRIMIEVTESINFPGVIIATIAIGLAPTVGIMSATASSSTQGFIFLLVLAAIKFAPQFKKGRADNAKMFLFKLFFLFLILSGIWIVAL